MQLCRRADELKWPSPPSVLLGLLAVYLLYLAVPNIGPALRAARADGVHGVFTARQLDCVEHPGHQSCTWLGDFRSYDGTIQKNRIALAGSGRDSLRAGRSTEAIDIGRSSRVYGPGGSNEWILTALLLLSGVGILGWLVLRPGSRRRPEPARARSSPPAGRPPAPPATP